MASYEDIRTYFDTSELLQNAVRNAAQIPIVTGVTLDIDPLWSHLYDVENDLVDLPQAPLWISDPRFFLYDRMLAPLGMLPLQPPDRGYRRRDLKKVVPRWEEEAEAFYKHTGRKRLPVVLTVVHRPLRAPRPGQASEEDDTSLLQQLVRTTRAVGVLLRIEERPVAALTLASGDQINVPPANYGTLGGILDDQSGFASYGITCSHVAQTGNAVHDAAGSQIGVCMADTARVSLASPRVCDPVNLAVPNPVPSNGPDVNMLDCSLIKLSSAVTRPIIAGVAQALTPGQSVVLAGAATGTTKHWLGSLCMSYSFSSSGQNFCFRDSIEMVPQPSGLMGRAVVPTHGDSGSWVLTDNQPPDWAGLCFGSDGKRSFAIRAKWVHEWAQKTAGAILMP